jgi:hypothetical protein
MLDSIYLANEQWKGAKTWSKQFEPTISAVLSTERGQQQ